ncbi:MAG: GatB/YqeY domain-containing protein [Patescibacteria group bacterium]
MPILDKIGQDLKESMKGGNHERSGVLRFLLSQVHNREIEKRGKGDSSPLTDEEVLDVFKKEVKKRKESIELFNKGGRKDLSDKEVSELVHITPYLPAAVTREEIEKVVAELRAEGVTDFPALMKAALARLKNAEGGEVAKVIKGA